MIRRMQYGPAPICKRCAHCVSVFNLPADTPNRLTKAKVRADFLCVLAKGTPPPTTELIDPCGYFANPDVHPQKFPENKDDYLKAFEKLFDVTQRANTGSNKEDALLSASVFFDLWWAHHNYWDDYVPRVVDPTYTCEHHAEKS